MLASGAGADVGKLVLLSPTTEVNAYGILLDEVVDTTVPHSDGSCTGSVAKAGSFRGPALIVPTGVDAGLIAVSLRKGNLRRGFDRRTGSIGSDRSRSARRDEVKALKPCGRTALVTS